MVYLVLKSQAVKSLSMNIDLQEIDQIELSSTFSFNVNYNDDNTACKANLVYDIKDENNPSSFFISLEYFAHFSCEGIENDEMKSDAHIMAYSLLFPYVQSMITKLTVDAGLPPLRLEIAKIEPEDIKTSETEV